MIRWTKVSRCSLLVPAPGRLGARGLFHDVWAPIPSSSSRTAPGDWTLRFL